MSVKGMGEVSEVNNIIAFFLFDDQHFPYYVAPPDLPKIPIWPKTLFIRQVRIF